MCQINAFQHFVIIFAIMCHQMLCKMIILIHLSYIYLSQFIIQLVLRNTSIILTESFNLCILNDAQKLANQTKLCMIR